MRLLLACIVLILSASVCYAEEGRPQALDKLLTTVTDSNAKSLLIDAFDLLSRRMNKTFQAWLNNAKPYLPMIQGIFEGHALPQELAYLPLIESGFSPYAVSPAGAVGLWQFMEDTGKRYGLKVDRYVDERRDPYKSTLAAAEYLKDLYEMFGSWSLVLASYNAGEYRIQKISAKAGENIWKSPYTPDETKKYVPLFIAAVTLAKHNASSLHQQEFSDAYQEVIVKKATDLNKIAKRYKTEVSALQQLNPALLTGSTPPYPYAITVPARSP